MPWRQVALGPKAKNGSTSVVTITVEGGRKAILGTLDAANNPHFEVCGSATVSAPRASARCRSTTG